MNISMDTPKAIAKEISSSTNFSTGQVISADGTIIGYRQIGRGPGLMIIHGGARASHHYLPLAEALANTYTVYLPDRRGRGLSGPKGEDYTVRREIEDLRALLQKTNANMLFGHSAGGFIALEAAVDLPVEKLALYEPAVSIDGSVDFAWIDPLEKAFARNDGAAACEMRKVARWWHFYQPSLGKQRKSSASTQHTEDIAPFLQMLFFSTAVRAQLIYVTFCLSWRRLFRMPSRSNCPV